MCKCDNILPKLHLSCPVLSSVLSQQMVLRELGVPFTIFVVKYPGKTSPPVASVRQDEVRNSLMENCESARIA